MFDARLYYLYTFSVGSLIHLIGLLGGDMSSIHALTTLMAASYEKITDRLSMVQSVKDGGLIRKIITDRLSMPKQNR